MRHVAKTYFMNGMKGIAGTGRFRGLTRIGREWDSPSLRGQLPCAECHPFDCRSGQAFRKMRERMRHLTGSGFVLRLTRPPGSTSNHYAG